MDEIVFPYVEGLGSAVVGVLGLFNTPLMLKEMFGTNKLRVFIEGNYAGIGGYPESTVFAFRMFWLSTFAFGGTLYLTLPELRRSTKRKLLAWLLVGDCIHLWCVSQHHKVLGGWNSRSVFSKNMYLEIF